MEANRMKEKMRNAVPKIDKKEFLLGVFLVFAGFLMPLVFTVSRFGVRKLMDESLLQHDEAKLLEAAMLLVMLNALRAIPHYIGAFFVGESIEVGRTRCMKGAVSAGMTVVVLLLTYYAIGWVHHIHYDFGIPAVVVCALVILFGRMDYRYISLSKKAVLITLFLTAFQFLDIMPIMERFSAGRGETSWNLKQAAAILDVETLLNVGGLVGVLIFALFGLIIWFQLRDENTLRALNTLKEQNQEIRMQARITEMENRTNREVQYLVHDLKSPLTAIQTMSGILRMEREQDGGDSFPKDTEYLDRIENAVDQMSRMISEILYEEKSSPVETEALLNIAFAQVSVADYAQYLTVENEVPKEIVTVNRILFPRVLVNLLQNSAQAMDGQKKPEIRLCVTAQGQTVRFSVSDNGKGIAQERQQEVWSRGVSGSDSSGLGLAFVRKTVEEMGGSVGIKSKIGRGTVVTIALPRGENTDV